MSFFSKIQNQKVITSTLVAGDEKIVLKFKPIGLKDMQVLSTLQTMGDPNADILGGMTKVCDLFASLIIGEGSEVKPTAQDFMELDMDTITMIIDDLTAGIKKKTQDSEPTTKPVLESELPLA
jgi:hypothetical protein